MLPAIAIAVLFASTPMKSAAQTETPVDTQSILKYLEQMQYYSKEKGDKDSAVFYMGEAFQLVPPDMEGLSFSMLLKIAEPLVQEHNEVAALEYYLHALDLIDEENEKKEPDMETLERKIAVYQKIAFCQRNYNPRQALHYWKESIRLAEEIHRKDPEYGIDTDRISVYNNIGSIFNENGDLDSAEHYYQKSFASIPPGDTLFTGKLSNNLGIVHAKKGQMEEAFRLFTQALACARNANDSLNMANILLNMGKSHYIDGNYPASTKCLLQSLDISTRIEDLRNCLYTNEQLADAYRQQGMTQKALRHLQSAYALKDSLFDMDKIRNSMEMELEYQYKKQREALRHQQEIELKAKESQMLFLLAVGAVLSLLVGLLTALYRMQRNKARCILSEQQSLSLQKENLELKQKALEKELEQKEKEMSIHAQYLLKRGEFMTNVIHQINEQKPGKDEQLDELLKGMQANIENSIWKEFKVLFQNLHSDFYAHLYEKHPDLTANEKRLCTFIRLNMSSKEISSITQQSLKSIEMARSRLRGKLGLKREDNLCVYLQQF